MAAVVPDPRRGRFQEPATRVLRNPRWMALGASPFLLLPVFLVLGAVVNPAIAIGCLHASIFGTLGMTWAYRANRNPRRSEGELAVDERGVHHRGTLLARLDEITGGFAVPSGDEVLVRLERRAPRPSLSFRVRDQEAAGDLLRAVGHAASQTVAEVRAASQVFGWSFARQLGSVLLPLFGMAILGALTVPLGLPFLLPVLVPLGVLSMLVLMFSRTRVRVGVDGIATRWLGRDHFYAFSRIDGVSPYEEQVGGKVHVGVMLTLNDQSRVKIPCGQKGWVRPEPAELHQRIEAARALHHPGAVDVAPALLARANRRAPDWVAALRAIGAGAHDGPRTSAITLERLLAIVDDPSAPSIQRVAAGIAAMERAPDEGRARVRIAAETTAAPALRRTFERVAESQDDDALAEALAELDTEEDARKGPKRSATS